MRKFPPSSKANFNPRFPKAGHFSIPPGAVTAKDTVPAMLRPGEGVLVPEATAMVGGERGINAMNREAEARFPRRPQHFWQGGIVGGPTQELPPRPAPIPLPRPSVMPPALPPQGGTGGVPTPLAPPVQRGPMPLVRPPVQHFAHGGVSHAMAMNGMGPSMDSVEGLGIEPWALDQNVPDFNYGPEYFGYTPPGGAYNPYISSTVIPTTWTNYAGVGFVPNAVWNQMGPAATPNADYGSGFRLT